MRGRHRSVALALQAGVVWASLALAAEGWVEIRSPSFTVVSDGSEKNARKVVLQFEQVRALLQEVWPGARVDTVRPVTILAVRDGGGSGRCSPPSGRRRGPSTPLASS